MFADAKDLQRAIDAPSLNALAIAQLYRVAPSDIEIIPYPLAFALKIVVVRRIVAGDPGDRDVYGAQQHAPLLDLQI
jgi:hypothetical protein